MNTEKPNTFLIPLSIVMAGALVAGAIYFGGAGGQTQVAGAGDSINPDSIKISVNERDHIVGSRNAEVVIIEYSDLECPFCKVFHNTMKEVVQSYDGRVAWVYRHFPIVQLHAKAEREAQATECAAELGGNDAFWSFTNKVFDLTNSNDSLPDSELPRIAAEIGLDVSAFNECLSSGRHASTIKKSVEDAIKSGARGTPYSIAIARDGSKVVINGAEPFADVKAKIDSLLK